MGGILLMVTSVAWGQSFLLTLTTTPSPIPLGSNVTYHLSVSNATGFNLNPGVIISEYSGNAELVRATNRFGITNSPGQVVFGIQSFAANEVLSVLLELRTTNLGLLTNTFTVTIDDQGQTTPAATNVVSSIELPPEADLGIAVFGPTDGVFPGDRFRYRLLATNAGPNAATGVVVSNPFPANVSLVSLSPSDRMTVTNGFVLFSAGTLTHGESAAATVAVLATNAAPTNLLSATIGASTVTDTNPANNSATSNVPILTPVLGQVAVTHVSTQQFNPQTGWIEQRVRIGNVSTTAVDSVRLLVDGLTNRLVNATGTNGSLPYVAHGARLAPGEQIELILEYLNPSRTAGTDPLLTAYGTPLLDLTPVQGAGIAVDRVVLINHPTLTFNNGRILLEWPAANGAAYQVIYDEGPDFIDAKGSLSLVGTPASANRVQWLDYGPPRTLSAPSNAPARFYKVIQLP